MNPILFQAGNFTIRWYSFLILIGVFLGYELAEAEAKKYEAPKDFIFNLTFWSVIIGLIGARIYYVIFNWSLYSHDLLSIFKFWEGGLAIHGGIIAGLLTMYFYCKKYNVKLMKITDIAVVSLLLAQAIGRWGNFFNSEAHGPATTLAILKSHGIIPQFIIDGMNIGGIYYEPTFYYESLWCFAGFIIILFIRKNKQLHTGTLTAFYFMWYSVARFFIESMRTDSLMLGGFKIAQIMSIIMFIAGLVISMINSRKNPFEDVYHETKLNQIRF
jgi:phosphatidylglycerol---prolipoprotein diacylglyceryl transferase